MCPRAINHGPALALSGISLVAGFALCWGDLWWPFQIPRGGCCCSTLFFRVPDVLSSGANGIIYPSHVLASLWCPLRKIFSLPVVMWVLPSAGPHNIGLVQLVSVLSVCESACSSVITYAENQGVWYLKG
ncbi:hypothetical protein U1Q18_023211 [Sarracenia purpurea var. burkii]